MWVGGKRKLRIKGGRRLALETGPRVCFTHKMVFSGRNDGRRDRARHCGGRNDLASRGNPGRRYMLHLVGSSTSYHGNEVRFGRGVG